MQAPKLKLKAAEGRRMVQVVETILKHLLPRATPHAETRLGDSNQPWEAGVRGRLEPMSSGGNEEGDGGEAG